MVRTSGSHPGNPGSIPGGVTALTFEPRVASLISIIFAHKMPTWYTIRY